MQEVIEVIVRSRVDLATLLQLLPGVLVYCLQHRKTLLASCRLLPLKSFTYVQEALSNQRSYHVKRIHLRVAAAYLHDRIQCATADEHPQPPEECLLNWSEQIVAPIYGRA